MNKAPKLRFEGFDEEWNLITLKQVAGSFDYGMNAAATEFDGENKYIRITDIDENTNKYISANVVSPLGDLEDKYLVKEDDILFARTGASTGKAYLYNPKDGKLYFAGFLIRAHINKSYNSKFVFLQTQTREYEKWVKIMSMRSGQPGINSQEYASYTFNAPLREEQEKIASFFSLIDKKIELQTEKVEELKKYKKGMTQKMFPRSGESVPELRFAGFSGDWEQRKLSEVAYYRNGKAHEKDIDENGEYVVVNSKFISTEGEVRKYSNKLIEPLKSGEITFVLSDVPNGKALAKTFLIDLNDQYSLNQRIAGITPRKNIDSYFLSKLLNRNEYFLKFDNGVGQTNLSKSDVENFIEFYPLHEEQIKIGKYFSNLDNLITLHQRKLEAFNDMKKSLLQQMFI